MDREKYENDISELSQEIRQLTAAINQLASLRLITALAAFILLLAAMWTGYWWLYLLTALSIAFFILLIRRFRERSQSRDYKRARRRVFEDRIARYTADWKQFKDNGSDLLDALKKSADDRLEQLKRPASDKPETQEQSSSTETTAATSTIGTTNTATQSATTEPSATDSEHPKQQTQAADKLHRYHLADDLDVLGPNSLFQRINLAFSAKGRQRLAEHLLTTEPDHAAITARQTAVAEIQGEDGFASHYAALIEMCRAAESKQRRAQARAFIDMAKIRPTPRSEQSRASRIWQISRRIIVRALPIATLLALIITALFPTPSIASYILVDLITVQLAWSIIRFYRINPELQTVEGFNNYIVSYKAMIEAIENSRFEAAQLQAIRTQLQDRQGQLASHSLERLERLGTRTASRRNTIAWLLLNGLLLWDEHCLDAYHSWRDDAGDQIESWLDACSEIEALLSLAAAAQCYDQHCLPQFDASTSTPQLTIRDLRHPLIDNERSIANDADLSKRAYVITGSNMSGKTTFLRAIGLSVLMAQAGAVIPAGEAVLSHFSLHSSIRVDDNVSAGISSFYAEILRIRAMAEATATGKPMLILIDEIFRGTNSADRVTGAEAAVTKLVLQKTMVLVSTHDFELCDLEYNEKVQAVNLHFQEYYENDEIHFDYKLREGRSVTTNARFLLQMAGIIES